MKLIASKRNIFIGLVLLVLIATLGVVLVEQNKNEDKNSEQQAQTSVKTPAEITKDPKSYINKEVVVIGRLLQADPNTYLIADIPKDSKPVAAIRLDFSKSKIDPSKYIISPPSPSTSAPTVSSPPKTDSSEKTKKLASEVGANATEKPKTMLTVRGKLVQGKQNTPISLVVISVQ